LTRLLFVVSRDHPGHYDHLKRTFADDAHVEVILDRRRGAQRRRDLEPPPAGRRTERRLTPTAGDLHQLGWTLVRPGPPRAN